MQAIALICIFMLGCGPVFEQVSDVEPDIFYTEGVKVSDCFIKNITEYTQQLGWDFEHLNVKVSNELHPWILAYYQPYSITINENAPNQLSAYGHELVRHHCFKSGDCTWYQSSTEWSGAIGELWNKAEALSAVMCHSH